MKVYYKQLYGNECGLGAIKNLLSLYRIKEDVSLKYDKSGTSVYDMVQTLKKYFYKVDAVSFDIEKIKKVKKFTPFIALISRNDVSHYVVVYRKNKRYLYLLDSLFGHSYKVTYKEFTKADMKSYIVCEDVKQISSEFYKNRYLFLLPFFAFIESVFTLSTTILLQQVIDNGISDAILYILIQLMLLFITYVKIKMFLKFFKNTDVSIVGRTLKGIFHLKEDYVNRHEKKEIFYRLFDAYSYKNKLLSVIFDMVNDGILLLLSVSLMFVYSYKLTFIILALCTIVVFISFSFYKKIRKNAEEKRINEYEFIDSFKKNFNESETLKYEETNDLLHAFQSNDYISSKLSLFGNYALLSFQSSVTCIIIALYVFRFTASLSVGSLIALINLSYLIISPLLSLCNEFMELSNIKYLSERLSDISKNII